MPEFRTEPLIVPTVSGLLPAGERDRRVALTSFQPEEGRVQVPQRMRRQNIALTLGLLMLALVLAALPAIGAFLQRLWNRFFPNRSEHLSCKRILQHLSHHWSTSVVLRRNCAQA